MSLKKGFCKVEKVMTEVITRTSISSQGSEDGRCPSSCPHHKKLGIAQSKYAGLDSIEKGFCP